MNKVVGDDFKDYSKGNFFDNPLLRVGAYSRGRLMVRILIHGEEEEGT